MTAKEVVVAPSRFYRGALSEAEESDLPAALEVEGIDEEIALLRLRLRTALEEHPEDVQLMFKGVELLVKLVATRYRLSKGSERDLAGHIVGVLRGFAPLLEGEGDD